MTARQLHHDQTAAAEETRRSLDGWARRWVWALPAWGALLAISTVTHQPDYKTDFGGYADYVTTVPFLISQSSQASAARFSALSAPWHWPSGWRRRRGFAPPCAG